MMKGIIYQLKSKSGKYYIGSTITSLDKRIAVHYSYFKKNNHTNKRLQGAYNKYGNFELIVLEEFEYTNKKEVINKEQYYLDLFKPEYNICKKAYISEMTQITKDKIRNTLLGTTRPQECKDKISKSKKGVKLKPRKGLDTIIFNKIKNIS